MQGRLTYEHMGDTGDYELFCRLAFDPAVMNKNLGRVFTQSEAQAYFQSILAYNGENHDSGTYRVELGDTREFVGICTLRRDMECCEVEYMLMSEYWGRGYAKEMAAEMIEKAKNLPGVSKVSATVDPQNIASVNVLLANGLVFEKELYVEEDDSTVQVYSRSVP